MSSTSPSPQGQASRRRNISSQLMPPSLYSRAETREAASARWPPASAFEPGFRADLGLLPWLSTSTVQALVHKRCVSWSTTMPIPALVWSRSAVQLELAAKVAAFVTPAGGRADHGPVTRRDASV